MDYQQMTAPCGLDCFNCTVYLSKDNESVRQGIAEKLGIPTDQVSCNGCRAENGTIEFIGMSEPCKVYQCITSKNLNFCSECETFPCDHLHPYADKAASVPHNTKVFNLCLIKRMGLENWAKEKAKSVRNTYFSADWNI